MLVHSDGTTSMSLTPPGLPRDWASHCSERLDARTSPRERNDRWDQSEGKYISHLTQVCDQVLVESNFHRVMSVWSCHIHSASLPASTGCRITWCSIHVCGMNNTSLFFKCWLTVPGTALSIFLVYPLLILKRTL